VIAGGGYVASRPPPAIGWIGSRPKRQVYNREPRMKIWPRSTAATPPTIKTGAASVSLAAHAPFQPSGLVTGQPFVGFCNADHGLPVFWVVHARSNGPDARRLSPPMPCGAAV
jgi:hypothetical protein